MNFINDEKISTLQKIDRLNWLLITLIISLAFIGFIMLYSAGGGSFRPWLIRQFGFFCLFFPLMIFIAVTDIKIWFKLSYLFYAVALTLVLLVDIIDGIGHNAMGATRWFKIGPIKIQPSEIMKVCTVFALAKYYYNIEVGSIDKNKHLIIPLLIILAPVVLIFLQPDLGTATILLMVGISILFLAGVGIGKFIFAGMVTLISIPFIWIFFLHDYQKKRVLTFLNPNEDPLGSGYNIIQSKIAIGSGGMFGKGLLNGTQGQLDFLPEKQTDFIFTMLAEELGFIGATITIVICCIIVGICIHIANNTKHKYGKLFIMGVVNIFFIHMFINMGMVMGVIPVVGAPLPFVSYGGTIMGAMMIGFGMVLNIDLNRNVDLQNLKKRIII